MVPFAPAALWIAACAGSSPTSSSLPSAVPPPPPPRVLIVSIDGLRPDAIQAVETPHIRGLAARGSYSWQAQTIAPSNTLPSHVSMLTGVIPSVHKVTWDEYLPSRPRLAVPSLFGAVKAAAKQTALVAGKEKFLTFRDAGSVDAFVVSARGDVDVANQTVLHVDAGFDLVFVHFPEVDLAGHASRWMSKDYLERLQAVDAAIGRILSVTPPNMSVILTADHGGSGLGHGTTAAAHMTIPWIAQGPRIKAGNQLSVRVTTVDTAVTAAHILGVKISDTVSGRVVAEAFEP